MDQTESAQKPATSTNEDPRAVLITFFKEIRSLFPKEEIESNVWVSKKGIFVKSEFTSKLVDAFYRWFQAHVGSDVTYSVEKAERKLFEGELRKDFYLVLGSSVTVGNLIEVPVNELRNVGIRLYEGIPLDTGVNLHHTDPVFLEDPSLRAQLTKSGYAAIVTTKHDTFTVPFDVISKLREFFIHSGEMRRYIQSHTMRALIKSFARSLGYVRPLNRKTKTLVPTRLLEDTESRWWLLNSIALVERDGVIKDFFPVHGAARENLIREELNACAQSGSKRVNGAYISLVKGSFLASCDILGIAHKFGMSAVLSFISELEYYAERNRGHLPGRLRNHFIAKEVIAELAFIVKDASPCMPDKIPGKVRERFHPGASVLVSKGEWFLSVDRMKMIREIAYAPKVQKKEIQVLPKPNPQGN